MSLSAAVLAAAVDAADWNDPIVDDGTGARASDVCALRRADRARTPSRVCISCHDGSAGTAVPSGRGRGIGAGHPVDIDYAAAEARHPGKLEPRAGLPASVPLVDGRVECTTCHDGRSRTVHRVVEHEHLCTSCHRL